MHICNYQEWDTLIECVPFLIMIKVIRPFSKPC